MGDTNEMRMLAKVLSYTPTPTDVVVSYLCLRPQEFTIHSSELNEVRTEIADQVETDMICAIYNSYDHSDPANDGAARDQLRSEEFDPKRIESELQTFKAEDTVEALCTDGAWRIATVTEDSPPANGLVNITVFDQNTVHATSEGIVEVTLPKGITTLQWKKRNVRPLTSLMRSMGEEYVNTAEDKAIPTIQVNRRRRRRRLRSEPHVLYRS